MSGSGGFSFARSHSGDRFYNPPAMRRHQQQMLQQQQQRHQKQMELKAMNESVNRSECDDVTSSKPSVSSSLQSRPTNSTNLDRFLESTTPLVPAQYFPKVLHKN